MRTGIAFVLGGALAASLLGAVGLQAQSAATQTSRLAWDQPLADLATAQAFTYTAYIDTLPGVVLAEVRCAPSVTGGGVTCAAPFPAATPGSHALRVTATNEAGESEKSAPFLFTFVVVPRPPQQLRLDPTRP